MKDSYGREINYLRISVTQRCNFRCAYCGAADPDARELSPGQFALFAAAFARAGITKIRLTGGEPLMREDIAEIAAADTILVLSCGVGVQTVADMFADKRVCAGCDTLPMPGFQGVTPLEYDCDQCGECYLNLTGGICPITACSKSLVNGQCGGAKNGKCECDSNMECGWERIYQRLKMLGRLDLIQSPVQVRNFATDLEVSK